MSDHVKEGLIQAASNPKVATAVAAGAGSTGFFSYLDQIQGVLSIVSMGVGILTASIVCAIQLIKLKRTWQAYKKGELEP